MSSFDTFVLTRELHNPQSYEDIHALVDEVKEEIRSWEAKGGVLEPMSLCVSEENRVIVCTCILRGPKDPQTSILRSHRLDLR